MIGSACGLPTKAVTFHDASPYALWIQKQENPTAMGQAFRKGVDIKSDYGI
jgi:hypothetical protein